MQLFFADFTEILQREPQENHDFGYVLHSVADELIGQFPPGGGFQSKWVKNSLCHLIC